MYKEGESRRPQLRKGRRPWAKEGKLACEGRWREKDDDEEMWRSTTTIGDFNAKTQLPPRAIGHARSKSIFPRFSARGRYLLVPCSVVFCVLGVVFRALSTLFTISIARSLERSLLRLFTLSTRPSRPSDPPGRLQPTAKSQRKCRRPTCAPLAAHIAAFWRHSSCPDWN